MIPNPLKPLTIPRLQPLLPIIQRLLAHDDRFFPLPLLEAREFATGIDHRLTGLAEPYLRASVAGSEAGLFGGLLQPSQDEFRGFDVLRFPVEEVVGCAGVIEGHACVLG